MRCPVSLTALAWLRGLVSEGYAGFASNNGQLGVFVGIVALGLLFAYVNRQPPTPATRRPQAPTHSPSPSQLSVEWMTITNRCWRQRR